MHGNGNNCMCCVKSFPTQQYFSTKRQNSGLSGTTGLSGTISEVQDSSSLWVYDTPCPHQVVNCLQCGKAYIPTFERGVHNDGR